MKFVLLSLFLFASFSVADCQIVATIDAPDTNISGLGFGNGSLWAVDNVTEIAYEIDPASGAVQNSWYCDNGTKIPNGLTFANNTVYIGMGVPPTLTGTYCYKYDISGAYTGQFSMDC